MDEIGTNRSRYYRQISLVGSLLFATVVCAGLLALRMAYTRELSYIDLLWNLFLAWLPLVSSLAAYNLYRRWFSATTVLVLLSALFWLLFFPNAPYLLTELMDLRASDVPLWYDLILLVAFAWTGSLLGHISLYLMQSVVRRAAGPLVSWLFALGTLGLGSLGIYLGRFLRWNSWDIFISPRQILVDIWHLIRHPFANLETIAFSVLFYLFLSASYWILVALMQFAQEQTAPVAPSQTGTPSSETRVR